MGKKAPSFTPEVQARIWDKERGECCGHYTWSNPAVLVPKEGSYVIGSTNCEELMLVPPNGSLRPCSHDALIASETHPELDVEIKCPAPSGTYKKTTQCVVVWYVCQVLAEMAALKVKMK